VEVGHPLQLFELGSDDSVSISCDDNRWGKRAFEFFHRWGKRAFELFHRWGKWTFWGDHEYLDLDLVRN
jgi:hypothetical protein